MLVIAVIVAIIVIWFIYKSVKTGTPQGFAYEIARVQLHTFYSLRNKYPDKDPEWLYTQTILTRPTYNEVIVMMLLRRAQDSGKLTLRSLVTELVLYEYNKRMGRSADITNHYPLLYKGVYSVIPEGL